MIYFDGVTRIYDDHAAVSDVTFSIEPGEFVSIVGHSGAGKTTLLRMLLVEERPTSGGIFF
jgi:ABC-type multidrug transport system ATPase subunit